MSDRLFFFVHDNWLPGLLVFALAAVLLRFFLIGRRGRMWRDLGSAGAAAAASTAAIGTLIEAAPAADPGAPAAATGADPGASDDGTA